MESEQPEHLNDLSARVTLAPAQNALNSLALLSSTNERPGLSPWIRQTRANLSSRAQHANRLVIEGLADVLLGEQELSNFPDYVDHLAKVEPAVLRDQLLGGLVAVTMRRRDIVPAAAASEGMELLTDTQQFVDVMRSGQPAQTASAELLGELHALLRDPLELQDLLVSSLRSLWEEYLAPEWERTRPILEALLPELKRRLDPTLPAPDLALSFLPKETRFAGAPADRYVQQTVFVLSPHMISSARSVVSGASRWIFFGLPPLPELLRASPIGQAELLARLGALADETNLQILALAAEQEDLSAQEVMARLELSQPNASRHLKQLSSTGYLLERRKGGATKEYRMAPAHVALTFQALERYLSGHAASSRQVISDALSEVAPSIRRFFDLQGRLTTWPARQQDQIAVLAHLASRFEPGTMYTEKEVNAVLNRHHTWRDPATLRRQLYDRFLLDRTSDGARYWRGDRRDHAAEQTSEH